MSEGLYEDEEELSYSREDGDTWKTSGGKFGGKYKGDIDYFDSEDKAKVFLSSLFSLKNILLFFISIFLLEIFFFK